MADRRVFVWIATLGKIRRGAVRVDADVEACTPAVKRQLAEIYQPDAGHRPYRMVLGLASISISGIYHTLMRLTGAQREQLHFWQSLADVGLSGHAAVFQVEHVTVTEVNARLQQLTDKKNRGLVNELEEGQGPRLMADLQQQMPELPPGFVPSTVVRLPAPFAQLLVARHGEWTSFLLPQVPADRAGLIGTRGLVFSWQTLQLAPPVLPIQVRNFAESELVLSADVALEIADSLREVAMTSSADNPACDLGALQRHVAILQLVHDQMQASHVVDNARDLQHRHLLSSTRVPYRTAFLLRVMMFAGVLRSAHHLKEALMHAVALVLPSTLAQTFRTLIDECSTISPAESTVSRWRPVLDAAIMVNARAENRKKVGRVSRMLMADSSVQHNRDFEHIVVSEFDKEYLPDLLQASNALVLLW